MTEFIFSNVFAGNNGSTRFSVEQAKTSLKMEFFIVKEDFTYLLKKHFFSLRVQVKKKKASFLTSDFPITEIFLTLMS